ncbi:MAG: hypothetical protein WCF95_05180 [bacterium]
MSFQFGNLPYGYNPYSANMTTLGGAFNDSPVWNLADPQVQSQMTLPLFANWGEVARNNQLMNLGNSFQNNNVNSGNFYIDLLRTQAMMSAGAPQQSNSYMSMMQYLPLLMQLKNPTNPNITVDRTSSKSDIYVDDDDDVVVSGGGSTDTKENTYDLTDGKNDAKDLKNFKNDKNDDSFLIYGDIDKFAKVSLETITGQKDATEIDLAKALEAFIDYNKLTKSEKQKIVEAVGNTGKLTIKPDTGKTIEDTSYYKLLKVLGFEEEGDGEIKKSELKVNTSGTVTGGSGDGSGYTFNKTEPLTGLKNFINNTVGDKTLTYGSRDEFAKATYAALREKGQIYISLDKFLDTFGIKGLSDDARRKITKLAFDAGAQKGTSGEPRLTESCYRSLIGKLGITKKATSITRNVLNEKAANLENEKFESISPIEMFFMTNPII